MNPKFTLFSLTKAAGCASAIVLLTTPALARDTAAPVETVRACRAARAGGDPSRSLGSTAHLCAQPGRRVLRAGIQRGT